jgi:hypothetical protein
VPRGFFRLCSRSSSHRNIVAGSVPSPSGSYIYIYIYIHTYIYIRCPPNGFYRAAEDVNTCAHTRERTQKDTGGQPASVSVSLTRARAYVYFMKSFRSLRKKTLIYEEHSEMVNLMVSLIVLRVVVYECVSV